SGITSQTSSVTVRVGARQSVAASVKSMPSFWQQPALALDVVVEPRADRVGRLAGAVPRLE
ncbi:MAG: hypothetical protein ACTML1_00635, partial [Cellulosimicrobium funkei]